MRTSPTLGLLLPIVRGDYYGAILSGATRQVAETGGRLIALQTQDANAYGRPRFPVPRLRHPLAWDLVDGFMIAVEAVEPESIDVLRRTGKPVVLLGFAVDGLDVPVVDSDGRTGITAAVRSLAEDGHRRIAFAGCLEASDVADRYDAFVAAMEAAGLTAEPGLCYRIADNLESGGKQAAEQMIAAGLPSTAVVCGCDRNAIGVLDALNAAGYAVPEAQSVVGFDDIESAVFTHPPLSTVRQYPESMGATAVELLTGALREGTPLRGRHAVPTTFLKRQSSGPAGAGGAPPTPAPPTPAPPTPAPLVSEPLVAGPLSTAVAPSEDAVTRRLGADLAEIVDAVEAAVTGAPEPPPERLRATFRHFFGQETVRENPAEMARALRAHADKRLAEAGLIGDERARERVGARLHEVFLLMMDEFARVEYATRTSFQDMFVTQYQLCMELLRSHQQHPRQLGWLRSTPFRAACLGVWRDSPPQEGPAELTVITLRTTDDLGRAGDGGRDGDGDGGGDRTGRQDGPVVSTLPVAEFPPRDLCDLVDPAAQEVVFVAPIRLGRRDWGLIAAVGQAHSRYGAASEVMNHAVAMVAVALDYEDVLTSLRDREEQMRRMALFDELTGLPNRTLVLDRLRTAILRAKRGSGYRYGVLFIDLDRFKLVNDSLGHAAGDELLIQVANRLVGMLRECDTAARLGGDEFLVLLDGLDSVGNLTHVAGRVQQALAHPFHVHGRDLFITASIGIAMGDANYDYANDIMRDADLAMYTAKSTRRGSHAVFNVVMHTEAVQRLEIEASLRHALEDDELVVHYQPIADLGTGGTAGVEALVRWRHPTRGIISPDDFLSVAEESGLIVDVGRKVLADACAQLQAWRLDGVVGPQVRMSVNLSHKQFWHDDLVAVVDECLARTGLPPEALALEITEGVVMHHVDRASKVLAALHDRGIELHIDDFGTGYSSLEALHRFPIDALKIDRSFVARLGVDRRGAELVRTIVSLGEILGIRVIAEGIETPEHQDHLRRLGCGLGQGFLFSAPLASADATRALARLRHPGSPAAAG